MVTITPEIIQAEIENLETIIPASDYHIVLLPVTEEKTTSGITLDQTTINSQKAKVAEKYIPIVKANPNIGEVKTGMGLLPQVDMVKGATRQEGIQAVAPWTLLPLPIPVTKGVVYAVIHHTRCLAFQINN
ncbi:hypothetical protein Q5H92_14630 [Hymenobacter sp. M29]|uniref:Uncharacterized protein n=1 Tax=Hymenobacter mellowenesis TaxID=3063995 RepID=A0ABT9ACM5_9BACT|nr:hypothetical protein [Hymenobacter sp. M29]MDO7847601.1 hypothetical protein [Hymenobacter sp. M29]